MKYVFEKSSLTLSSPEEIYHKKWFDVANVVLEIVSNKKPDNPQIANPALNGKYVIKGIFDHHCIPSQSPIKAGKMGILRLSNGDGKYALLPVLFLDLLGITNAEPRRRCYTWYYGGVSKPTDDNIGLIASCQGEISLDDLLEEIGATREMMEALSVKFDAEGGIMS